MTLERVWAAPSVAQLIAALSKVPPGEPLPAPDAQRLERRRGYEFIPRTERGLRIGRGVSEPDRHLRLRRAVAVGEVTGGIIDIKEESEPARGVRFVRFDVCSSAIRCGLHDATQETSRLPAQAPGGYCAAAEPPVVTHSDYK